MTIARTKTTAIAMGIVRLRAAVPARARTRIASSVASGLRLWHGDACPLRPRLIHEQRLARSDSSLPIDRDEHCRRRQDLNGEAPRWRRGEHRSDRERVAGSIHADDANPVATGVTGSGKDPDVHATSVWRRERTEAERRWVGPNRNIRRAVVPRLLGRA